MASLVVSNRFKKRTNQRAWTVRILDVKDAVSARVPLVEIDLCFLKHRPRATTGLDQGLD